MCTTCSECVADVYVGVKTHLCNINTRPCTSAHNTCKVHVTLTAKKMHIYISLHTYIYACICTRLILIAFITGNSSLEPLIEGLCAQIHVNLS